MIERVGLHPYDLPLRRAWDSARGGFDRRRGWLVSVESDGLTGYGDCAPLPAAGTETHETAWNALTRLREGALGRRAEELLVDLEAAESPAPTANWALECALADLISRRQDTSLRHWLAPEAIGRIPVNVMLGALDTLSGRDLQLCLAQGFRVLKLKVGLASPASELERLRALAPALPSGSRLRLDANGAWGFDAACWLIERLTPLPIESIEEPLREPTPERLAELQAMAPFALALDESLPRSAPRLDPGRLGVRRLVLKPAALGGLRRTLALARRAQGDGVEVVITSLVESAAGLWPTAQLAAAIGTPIPHGLATADWLAADLGQAPRACAGAIQLPSQPGSGFAPATAHEHRHA